MDWLIKFLRIENCGAIEVTAAATCFYVIIALVTLVAVLWIGLGQLRQMSKDAHKKSSLTMLENWDSQNMLNSRATLAKIIRTERSEEENLPSEKQIQREAEALRKELYRLEKKGSKEYYEIIHISDYMEAVGYMMTSEKDRKIVKDLLGDAVTRYYQLFLPWIQEERHKYPRLYEYFTAIYEFCKQ